MENLNAEQIKKALECCASPTQMCKDCPMPEEVKDDCRCMETISRNALSLIKELTEEIKAISERYAIQVVTAIELDKQVQKLTEENERLKAENEALAVSEVKECEISQMLVYRIRNKHPAVMAVIADTVQKMQDRFNKVFGGMDATQVLLRRTFDQIAKEMLEGK